MGLKARGMRDIIEIAIRDNRFTALVAAVKAAQ